jgi:hypothetical protein
MPKKGTAGTGGQFRSAVSGRNIAAKSGKTQPKGTIKGKK